MTTARYPLSILLVLLLVSAACGQAVTPPPYIGVYGNYSATLSAWLGKMGADCEVMTREDLQPARLRSYRLVVVSRPIGNYALSAADKSALADYVKGGGRLLACATNFPGGGVFPSRAKSGYSEGWGGNLIVAGKNSPLAGTLKPGVVLPYGAWSSGYGNPPTEGIKVWAVYTAQQVTRAAALTGGLQAGKPAIFSGQYGRGKYVWCGVHLGYAFRGLWPAVFRAIVDYLVPDAGHSAFLDALTAKVPIQQDASRISGQTIAILNDPTLPAAAMPKGVTADFVARALTAAGRQVERLTVSQAVARGLDANRYSALIWMCGETAPVELIKPLKGYLAGGGGLILPAGRPLASLVCRAGQTWQPYGHEPRFLALFDDLLPFTKFYHAVYPPTHCLNLAPDLLPDLPPVWNLSGGDLCLYPRLRDGYSSRTVRKLAASISEGGEVCGVPLWINNANPTFPCARVLALGFTGASHPWNPRAWPYARQAVVDFVNLVCRKRQVVIKDLWTERPCYRRVEPVKLHVQVAATAPGPVTVEAVFARRDTGAEVHRARTTVTTTAGQVAEVTLTWTPPAFHTWAYDVAVTARQGAETARDWTLFTVWQPQVFKTCPNYTIRNGILYRNSTPQWLAGTNLYLNDARSITAFWGPHPLPDFWDRDFSYQDLIGCNANRQHYSQSRISIADLRSGKYNMGLSTADFYCLLSADHQEWTKFGVNADLLNWKPAPGQPFAPRDKWPDEEYWLRTMATRYKDAPQFHWEIINEPHQQDPSIYDWVTQMKNTVVGAMGKLPSCAVGWFGFDGVWSPQGAPRGLPFNDLHWYSPSEGLGKSLKVPYGMDLAWPALLGEMGMPNAGISATTQLGDWGPIYDRMLHYLIGEQGLGFLNFYLTNLSSTRGNEWGLLHFDMVEKQSGHAFKRWLTVTRHLNKADYLPPDAVLPYSMDQYGTDPQLVSRSLQADFTTVFKAGFRPRLLDQRDLATYQPAPRIVFVPGWAKFSETTMQQLKTLAAAGSKLVKLGDPGPALAGLPLAPFDSVKPDWKVTVSPNLAVISYVLPKKDGGQTVVLVGGTGKSGSLRFAGHEVTTTVKPGRCATFDFAPDGSLLVAEAWGDLTVDGRRVLAGGPDGYALASLDGRPLFSGGRVELDAPDQSQVRLATAPANSLATLGSVTIDGPAGPAYVPAVAAVKDHLAKLGVKVTVVTGPLPPAARTANLIVIGNPKENPLAAAAQRECHGLRCEWHGDAARPCLRFGRARIWYPWCGAIVVTGNPWAVGKKLMLVEGLTSAGTQLASRKLASLTLLASYSVGPTERLRGDL